MREAGLRFDASYVLFTDSSLLSLAYERGGPCGYSATSL